MFHERLREYKKSVNNIENDLNLLRSKQEGNRQVSGDLLQKDNNRVFELSSDPPKYENVCLGKVLIGNNTEKSDETKSKVSYCSQSLKSNDSSTKDEYVKNLRNVDFRRKRELIISNEYIANKNQRTNDDDFFAFDSYVKSSFNSRNEHPFNNKEFENRYKKNQNAPNNGFVSRKNITSYKFYDTLGVQLGSNISEIKRSYRKKATKYHPDKLKRNKLTETKYNEYLEKFQEIQEAYEILSNPNKKGLYDEYGDEILKYGIFESLNGLKEVNFNINAESNSGSSSFAGSLDLDKTEKQNRTINSKITKYVGGGKPFNGNNGVGYNINLAIDKNNGHGDLDFEWKVYWQRLLIELFIIPVLRNNCLELRDVGGMNISVSGYGELIRNSQRYLRNMKNFSEMLFSNPISLFLNTDSYIKTNFKREDRRGMEAGGRNSLFSRLTEKLSLEECDNSEGNNESSNIRFNNIQMVCGTAVGNAGEIKCNERFSINGLNLNDIGKLGENLSGLIFGESSESWEKLLKLAKTGIYSNYDGYSGSLKRRLKSIQNEYNWIVLIFVSEEFLPLSDQELLLELYTAEDTNPRSSSLLESTQDETEEQNNKNEEIIDCTTDFKSLSLFPCLIFRPKRSENKISEEDNIFDKTPCGVSREDIVYTRPSRSQIKMVCQVLEFVFQLDETGFHVLNDKSCKLITN
ncbi:DnaJ domain-containing protein [Cryptosporidium bovis]|uniref:DnaJ domain-containing protein n=1 Tax=Cryptosporidium bovis TaxID=310047 RepID=UPI00351A0001|nr:DnaJ domain-containing protein [Cryptosporidium bovis]